MAVGNELDDVEARSTATITVPDSVYDRIDGRLSRSEFETVDEYATFVLESVLGRVEEATDEPATTVDRDEVETRLEALGYLE